MSYQSPARLLVAHAIGLKGVADTSTIADHTGLDATTVEAEVGAMADSHLVEARNGRIAGFALTPEGSFILRSMLDDELRDEARRVEVEAAYSTFLEFNHELLQVCTDWQLRDDGTGAAQPNDHSDPTYDRTVIGALEEVHDRVIAVIDLLAAALPRFAMHRTRLQNALDQLRAGNHDYFTKPMFPSYHSCWFELHEDLLATLGLDRRSERSQQ